MSFSLITLNSVVFSFLFFLIYFFAYIPVSSCQQRYFLLANTMCVVSQQWPTAFSDFPPRVSPEGALQYIVSLPQQANKAYSNTNNRFYSNSWAYCAQSEDYPGSLQVSYVVHHCTSPVKGPNTAKTPVRQYALHAMLQVLTTSRQVSLSAGSHQLLTLQAARS